MNRLNGKCVYVVPFEERHLVHPKYYEWLIDLKVMRYIGREEYLKPIEFAKVRQYVEQLWHSKYCLFFAVYRSESDQFIGTTKINYFHEAGLASRTADIGIMIGDRDSWGQGIATDALHTVCNYAFSVQNARKLTAGAMAPNLGAIKAFKKIGFLEEACLRKQLLMSDEYVDHVLLGCFREELRNA